MPRIIPGAIHKCFCDVDYNYDFNKKNGKFARWGKTFKDDPPYSPYGNEILDIEISTICHGINGKPCKHCYKSNTGVGKNMSLETYQTIIKKMPKYNHEFFLTQVALGLGDVDANPDLIPILEFTRSLGIIPNLTINGDRMTSKLYDQLASFVALS